MRILKQRKTAGERSRIRHRINQERVSVHVSKGDTVRVMRGDDKGKEGVVLQVYPKTNRVRVKGVNFVKKHRRARQQDEQSEILSTEAPIAASNVMLVDPRTGAPTRVRAHYRDDESVTKRSHLKERVSAKSGEVIPFAR